MKVTEDAHNAAMANLLNRRKSGHVSKPTPAGDYAAHLRKVKVGRMVLDVGCGDKSLLQHLPDNTAYVGVDAFPVSPDVIKMKIENCYFDARQFDTVFAFAVLDGVRDLSLAIIQMKRVCKNNIVILTGVNIPPDQYHTIEIKEDVLDGLMDGFVRTYREEVEPKVLLLEYTRA